MNTLAILPELILCAAGVLIMVLIPVVGKRGQERLGQVAVVALAAALAAALLQGTSGSAFYGMIFQDAFGNLARALFLLASAAILLAAGPYLRREGIMRAEFHCLMLFATVGMCFMATSADLMMTFLGLETLSIATYVLAGFRTGDDRSNEAAWKYFILGAFSTAFMLYGMAFLYGAAGSTKYLAIAQSFSTHWPAGLYIGIGLLLVGFGFKVAMAPFHVWAPDVYQGAPLPVTAHLAVGSKAAAFVALLRIFQQMAPTFGAYWSEAFWAGAAATMLIGNIAALVQTNLKRLLAYSSIAHAGYILVGLAANNSGGAEGILYYLVSYAFMTIGAFTVIQVISRQGENGIDLDDFKGIGFRMPFLSVSLSIFLISMAGIPTTAGFMGKFFLFSAAVQQHLYGLVVLAVIASAIGLYYYLRVIVCMFMQEGSGPAEGIRLPMSARIVIGVMLAGTLLMGLYPAPLLEWTHYAVKF